MSDLEPQHSAKAEQLASQTDSQDTIDIPVVLESNVPKRSRSNSKVYSSSDLVAPTAQSSNGATTHPDPHSSSPPPLAAVPALPGAPGLPAAPPNPDVSSAGPVPGSVSPAPAPATASATAQISRKAKQPTSGGSTNGSNSKKQLLRREEFIHILILVSLNKTFDRRTLKIPNYPHTIKLGRPNTSQRTPSIDNGYFDSKVISREHAELYMQNGKLYIKDLDSSNGTFLNQVQIKEPQELRIGDTIDLGIDIDTEKNKHQHHMKISCYVENFLTLPVDGTTDSTKLLNDLKMKWQRENEEESNPFDAAMFGDVLTELDDLALGLDHDFLSGIFVNNNIGTSSNLTKSIKTLMNQLHLEKVNAVKLDNIEELLEHYMKELRKNQDIITINNLKTELENEKSINVKANNKIQELNQLLSGADLKMKKIVSEYEEKLNDKNKDFYEHLTKDIKKSNKRIEDKRQKIKELQELLSKKDFEYERNIKQLNLKIMEKDRIINELNILPIKDLLFMLYVSLATWCVFGILYYML